MRSRRTARREFQACWSAWRAELGPRARPHPANRGESWAQGAPRCPDSALVGVERVVDDDLEAVRGPNLGEVDRDERVALAVVQHRACERGDLLPRLEVLQVEGLDRR